MNPIDLLYSWQALVVATIVYSLTQGIKVGLDILLAPRDGERPTPVPTGDTAPPPQTGRLGPLPVAAARLVEPVKRVADTQKQGRKRRKEMPWLDRFVLPGVPLALGVVVACLIPIRPDALNTYVEAKHLVGAAAYSVYGAWGASVGQFADYLFSKAKRAMEALQSSGGSGGAGRRDDSE